jgi:hypothetical protein
MGRGGARNWNFQFCHIGVFRARMVLFVVFCGLGGPGVGCDPYGMVWECK